MRARSVDAAMQDKPATDPIAFNGDVPPAAVADNSTAASTEAAAGLNGASHPAETATPAPGEAASAPPAESVRPTEKSGA